MKIYKDLNYNINYNDIDDVLKLLRGIYHLPIWQGELAAELVKLKSEDFRLICGHLAGNEILPEPGRRCVLIIGNEGNGVSDAVAALCDKYRLPMFGRAESLNASVAAGIMMYEIAKEMRK